MKLKVKTCRRPEMAFHFDSGWTFLFLKFSSNEKTATTVNAALLEEVDTSVL